MKIKNTVLKILLAQFLMMVCASIASAQYVPLVDYTNQVWRYNDTSTSASNPQGTFMTPGFDDSVAGWKTGKALFGNDDANVYNSPTQPFRGGVNGFATPLDRTGGRVTFYFRTHFNIASPPVAGATLFSTNYLDDGAVFYINGVDVGRTRVPAGALTWDTVGSNPATEGAPVRIDMPATALQVGDNVLAVEVHQSAPGSSDVAFAMNLILINPFCVQILDQAQPADTAVVQNRAFTLRAVADASPPISYQWVKDDVDIVGANSPTYSVARAPLDAEGNYYCRISNPVCTTNTRTAFVDVIPDQTPPEMLGAVAPNFTTLVVQFNEAMLPGVVLDTFSWTIIDPANPENALAIQEPGGISQSADGAIVTIQLTSGTTFEQDRLYNVTITAPTDLAENVGADASRDFRTYTTAGCNSFLFEAFYTSSTAGNAITLLLNHPNYPNNPMDRARIPSFDSRHGYSTDTHEQYGGRIRGLFVPTITGPWTFYLASDDASRLYVNPTGPDSAGKIQVAEEINCCNNFQATGDAKTSVPINLTAGQAYYVEAIYKEGTGGDWLKVAARPSSEPVPPGPNGGNGPPNSAISPDVIQSGAGPAGILSHITIATQPQSNNVIQGGTAQYSVGLSADVPACYQWRRDGVDIAGAIGPTYRFTTTLADDETRYSVQVSLMGGTVLTSDEAGLNVFVDTIPPVVTSVAQSISGDLTVTWNEALDLSTATNRNNYAIDGVTAAAAVATGNSVILLTPAASLAACPGNHTISVANVKDNSGVMISPTNVTAVFQNLLLVPINGITSWRYDESGNELGDAWYASAFDDSSWSNGVPGFGVESAGVLPIGFPIRTSHNWSPVKLSLYYRTHFNLASDPSSLTNLQIQHYIDDGAVFYLNGQELTRVRISTAATINTNLLADNYGETTPGVLSVTTVPATLLVSGDNVLAARVHQSGTTSSDTAFMAGLIGLGNGCAAPRPVLSISRSGNSVTITSTLPGTLYKADSLSGPWSSVGTTPQTLAADQPQQFFEIRP